MKKIRENIDFSELKKKENLLIIFVVMLMFSLISINFLSSKAGEKEIEYVSPYVADCSFSEELIDGMNIKQSFFTKLDVIEGIYLETATYARKNTSNISLKILDVEGNIIFEEMFSLLNAKDNQFSYFEFTNPLSVDDRKDMILQIEAVGNKGGNGICLVYSNYDSYNNGELEISGQQQVGDCFFGIAGYKINDTVFNPLYVGGIILLLLFLLFFCIILFCRKDDETEKKIFRVRISYVKVVKIFLVFGAVISIGRISYSVVNTVLERTQVEYMVHIDMAEPKSAEKSMEIDFKNQSKNLISDNIMIKKQELYVGEVTYTITDMEGNEIKECHENISSLINSYNDEWDEIIIACSDIILEQGKEYKIILEFSQAGLVHLIMNEDGQVQQRQIMENSYRNVYKLCVLLVAMTSLIFIAYALIVEFSDKMFLISALVIGVITCFIQTPCAADDEYRHFLRAYDLANSSVQAEESDNWVGTKGNVIIKKNGKADIIEVSEQVNTLRLLDVNQNYDNISYEAEMNYKGCIDAIVNLAKQEESGKQSVSLAATNDIVAVAYLPQIVFLWIGRALGIGVVGMFYIARFGNMLFATLVTYLIVKKLPEYRNVFFVIHFAPNALWLRASCNRDAFVTAIVTLIIAYIMYIRVNKLKIFNIKRLAILCILTVIVAICKLPYILVVGLLITLDRESLPNISGIKSLFVKMGLIIMLGGVGIVGYKLSTYEVLSENTIESEAEYSEEETHVSYALKNPQKVASVFGSRILNISEDIYRALEGYGYQFMRRYVLMVLVVLLLCKTFIGIKDKLWILAVFGAIWLLLLVVGYTWMPPDYGAIWGINPRYMIPILPLLGVVVTFGNDKTEKIINVVAPTWMLTLTTIGVISMITVYW